MNIKSTFLIFIVTTTIAFKGFSQGIPPPPPPSDFENSIKNETQDFYELKTDKNGNTLTHSNKFFSFRCTNLGLYNGLRRTCWFMTNLNPFPQSGKEISIWAMDKSFFYNLSDELKGLKYEDILKNWDVKRIGQYFFTYSPYTSKPFSQNLDKAKLVKTSVIQFDNTQFLRYEFDINGKKEVNYLSKINDVFFVFHFKGTSENFDNFMNEFKRK